MFVYLLLPAHSFVDLVLRLAMHRDVVLFDLLWYDSASPASCATTSVAGVRLHLLQGSWCDSFP